MSKEIKISVIIPVYNVERYLSKCLNSVINQTFKDLEIIAINDGSTDNSLNILNDYKEKYEFIKVINQTNKGVSRARNEGFKIARGEYIYFLDGDDCIDNSLFEIAYESCKSKNLDIITFDATVFSDEECNTFILERWYDRSKLIHSNVKSGKKFYSDSIDKGAYRCSVCINLYKRDLLKKNNIYFYEGISHEDEIFTIKAFINSQRILYIPQKLFNRRIRPNSTMSSGITKKSIDSFEMVTEEVYKFYNESNLDNETKKRLTIHLRKLYRTLLYYCDNIENKHIFFNKRDKVKNKIYARKIGNFILKIQMELPSVYYSLNIKNLAKKIIFKKIK